MLSRISFTYLKSTILTLKYAFFGQFHVFVIQTHPPLSSPIFSKNTRSRTCVPPRQGGHNLPEKIKFKRKTKKEKALKRSPIQRGPLPFFNGNKFSPLKKVRVDKKWSKNEKKKFQIIFVLHHKFKKIPSIGGLGGTRQGPLGVWCSDEPLWRWREKSAF